MNPLRMQIQNADSIPTPYLEQYVGAWSIDEAWATQFITLHAQTDMATHTKQIASSGGLEVADGVAIIQLQGMMTKRGSSFTQSEGTVAVRRQIRAAMADESVDAILLLVESPGGTVAGTKELSDDVRAAADGEKPVVAYIEDIGASAAYYVASQANYVYANKPAMVGSIGTFMVLTDSSAMAEDIGVKVHVVRAGDFKGAAEPGTEVTDEQLEYFQALITSTNQDFLAAVQRGRGFSTSELETLATGKVFTATDAVQSRLIDGVQSFEETLSFTKGIVMADTVAEPKAATLKELQSALVGADNDFIVDQLGQDATLQEAQEAWIIEQQDRLQAAQEAAEKATAEATQGVDPVGEVVADSPSRDTSAADEWQEKVNAKVAKGMDRMRAVSAVNRENPGLREAMLEECQS